MHYNTIKHLKRFKRLYNPQGPILEVGSCDINGSARKVFPEYDYTGVDIQKGPGVDKLIYSEHFHLPGYRTVLCCNTMEHVRFPLMLMGSLEQATEYMGLIFITAPFAHVYHRHPIDTYRYSPDAMHSMIAELGTDLQLLECYLSRASVFTPLSYFSSLRMFGQHLHGIALMWKMIVTRQWIPHVDCITILRKI